jgi:competence protein ComEC
MKKLRTALVTSFVIFIFWSSAGLAADLQVHFINVGQGDSILVISPNGKKLLVDAGIHPQKDSVWNPFSYIRKLKEEGRIDDLRVDYAIITHPHDDHYKGFSYLCSKDKDRKDFSIANLYYSVDEQKSYGQFWKCLQTIRKDTQSSGQISARGPPLDMGNEIELIILYPFQPVVTPNKDKNDDSVVLKLKYKNVSVLLTGDASSKVEKQLLEKDIQSSVLKLGHHGSKTASSKSFLEKVKPESDFYAVVSANCEDGKGKTYGHPNKEPLERLKALGEVNLYRTDLHGTIVFTTDGESISVVTENEEIPVDKLWEPGVKSK